MSDPHAGGNHVITAVTLDLASLNLRDVDSVGRAAGLVAASALNTHPELDEGVAESGALHPRCLGQKLLWGNVGRTL